MSTVDLGELFFTVLQVVCASLFVGFLVLVWKLRDK